MSGYKQLTYEQRCQIEVLKKSGFSQESIGQAVGASQSAISRELSRNRGGRGYRHRQAHMRATERRKGTVSATKMKSSLRAVIDVKLGLHWSPEQISGWSLADRNQSISHESIYRHVWVDKKAGGAKGTLDKMLGVESLLSNNLPLNEKRK